MLVLGRCGISTHVSNSNAQKVRHSKSQSSRWLGCRASLSLGAAKRAPSSPFRVVQMLTVISPNSAYPSLVFDFLSLKK